MSEISCYLTTFNCGRTLLDVDFFATSLFNGLHASSSVPPDLLVLTLQEIAPVAQSFLGGTLLAAYFSRFHSVVRVATSQRFGVESQDEYRMVATEHVGMTAIMIFAQPHLKERIKDVRHAGVGVGMWEMGNKGAVGVRLSVETSNDPEQISVVTLVAAHLAPSEDQCSKRNEDWQRICEGLVFERRSSASKLPTFENEEAEPLLSSDAATDNDSKNAQTLFSPASHIFFAGDLNYRTADTGPSKEAYRNWPSAVHNASSYTKLFQHDQLNRERDQNRTLHHLNEAEVNFPPTYKYSSAAQKQAIQLSRSNSAEQHDDSPPSFGIWAKHRVPSWCDRILFTHSPSHKVHTYISLPIQPTSDHRPVVLASSLGLQPAAQLPALDPPFSMRPDWKSARSSARRLEVVVGILAYLTLTREGEALLAGSIVGIIGGCLVLRALI